MLPFNHKQSPMFGHLDAERCDDPVARRCKGCGVTVYVTGWMEDAMGPLLEERGQEWFSCCEKCARPWLENAARHGGMFIGDRETLDNDIAPAIKEVRQRDLERN